MLTVLTVASTTEFENKQLIDIEYKYKKLYKNE